MGYLTTSARAAEESAATALKRNAPSKNIVPGFICFSVCWVAIVLTGERLLRPRRSPHLGSCFRNGSADNSRRPQPDRCSSFSQTAAFRAVRLQQPLSE